MAPPSLPGARVRVAAGASHRVLPVRVHRGAPTLIRGQGGSVAVPQPDCESEHLPARDLACAPEGEDLGCSAGGGRGGAGAGEQREETQVVQLGRHIPDRQIRATYVE